MYRDRQDAGHQLVEALRSYQTTNPVILALPRGGVVIGVQVARALQAPLGIVLVRKITRPSAAEYAIGAIAENDQPVLDATEAATTGEDWLQQAITNTRAEIKRQHAQYYQSDSMLPTIQEKTAIIVDDGIATGLTMEAAVRYVRSQRPKQVIAAAPVAAGDSARRLQHDADEVIILEDPHFFRGAVGAHYANFNQISNEEARELLREVQHDDTHHDFTGSDHITHAGASY